jgi:hypothetical protein
MWKFRYSLTSEKNALTKFLKCVDWADSREVQNAQQLLKQVQECTLLHRRTASPLPRHATPRVHYSPTIRPANALSVPVVRSGCQ